MAKPEASTTAGTRCSGIPKNRSQGSSDPSSSTTAPVEGSSAATRRLDTKRIPRSANVASSASEDGMSRLERRDDLSHALRSLDGVELMAGFFESGRGGEVVVGPQRHNQH